MAFQRFDTAPAWPLDAVVGNRQGDDGGRQPGLSRRDDLDDVGRFAIGQFRAHLQWLCRHFPLADLERELQDALVWRWLPGERVDVAQGMPPSLRKPGRSRGVKGGV